MKDEIAKVRQLIANKDNETTEAMSEATNEMQKASLKLFEMAYKKVCFRLKNVRFLISIYPSLTIFSPTLVLCSMSCQFLYCSEFSIE